VVNSSRLYIKPSDYPRKGLILINSYPKAPRREKESKEYIMYGPRESLLLFKLTQPIIPKTNETQK
jgi:hypothetical protein